MSVENVWETRFPTPLRAAAWHAFWQKGLPTRRWEDWKYTDLSRLLQATEYAAPSQVASDQLALSAFPDAYVVALENGVVNAALSQLEGLPVGVSLQPLAQFIKQHPTRYKQYCAAIDPAHHPMATLNHAFAEQGVVIEVEQDVTVNKPIHVIYVTSGETQVNTYHNLVLAQPKSQVMVIESACNTSTQSQLLNTLTQVTLEQGAKVEVVMQQSQDDNLQHIHGLHSYGQEYSCLRSFHLGLGAALGRVNQHFHLQAPEACCHAYGAFHLAGKAHLDHHIRIEHEASHTQSDVHFRGLLDQKAKGVFNSKAIVHAGTKAVDAKQYNHNLLLAKTAEMNTKPELEIYTDDVQCAHGATVGQLDKEALFYLQSRGVPVELAQRMLMETFLAHAFNPVRDRTYGDWLFQQLGVQHDV